MHTLEDLKTGRLKYNQKIKISQDLTEIPKEIFDLSETLEILDLSGNKIKYVPNEIKNLKKLRILFLSDNIFEEFPETLTECQNLEMIGFKANHIKSIPEGAIPTNTKWLILTNNQITTLPKSIGKCHRLQKCMLAGNHLSNLPAEMANCKNIELLRISANKFSQIPEFIFNLPRLAWLAVAGNPIFQNNETLHHLKSIEWDDIQILEKLGEGASGNIFKAKANKSNKEFALKIYKGGITSDGFASDELSACLHVGDHPNLVKTLMMLKKHPENKQGLVFELIPSNYRNLGLTPSFESCTRDVFDNTLSLNFTQIHKICTSVASSMIQLHNKGIMHGDLYAHNILVDEEFNTIFGDFGAAVIYDKKNTEMSQQFEKLDLRAFGFLMDDLLGLSRASDPQMSHKIETLQKIKLQVLDFDYKETPSINSFKSLLDALNSAS